MLTINDSYAAASHAAVLISPEAVMMVDDFGRIDGGEVLAGWTVELEKLFSELERQSPQ